MTNAQALGHGKACTAINTLQPRPTSRVKTAEIEAESSADLGGDGGRARSGVMRGQGAK